jgi:exodeoxyribonuclease VII large subunit
MLKGSLSTYPRTSRYQLIISEVGVLDDEAAILSALRALEERLRAEGVFAQKRSLPAYPNKIGVITSLDGAVLEDMKRQFERCMPTEVLVRHTSVQGASAVDEIVSAIDVLLDHQVEVIIVARGGGSMGDLLVFSDERLVRAVAACRVPTISAIGHDTDTPLCDHAADLRAPTPTAAPLLALPLQTDLLTHIDNLCLRASERIDSQCAQLGLYLDGACRMLDGLPAMCELYRQNIEVLVARARGRLLSALDDLPTVQSPVIDTEWIGSVLSRARTLDLFRWFEVGLEGVRTSVATYNPEGVLEQGYAIVRGAGGRCVTHPDDCVAGGLLDLVFRDGVVRVRVE